MSLSVLGCGSPQLSWCPKPLELTDSGIAENLRTLQESFREETRFWKKSFGLKFFLADLQCIRIWVIFAPRSKKMKPH